ncbi:MAG: acetate--CoA ligase [Phycisphaerae bacterium]|nr:acetate--CoA ligase [Phycisphaerae bacterium]
MNDNVEIDSVLREDRVFPPPAGFSESVGGAWIASMADYDSEYRRSIEEPEAFWGEAARDYRWMKPFTRVLEWNCPDARWFADGTLNLCDNCVDRHVDEGHGDDTAIIWEGEPVGPDGPEILRISYRDLQRETARFGNALKALGVGRGDIVTIYMGMVPEVAIAMLACARIGAAHSVIFGGFSASAIVDRVNDADSKVILTCDGAWRRGKVVPLKANVDEACASLPGVEHVVMLERCGNDVERTEGRDHDWGTLVSTQSEDCPCEEMAAEDLLFLLYTSGSTGKPKGIVHTTAGYLVHAALTAKNTFNLRPGRDHVYWCTADVGWITGHSYILYGILPNRVPCLMYEGAPNAPDEARFWDIVERHRVTHFYTAPTAIRAFMKWGDGHPEKHDLSSLKVLGTVGEPINPEAWIWYHEVIGGERCPIVDTWWQTETGGHMITPQPAATPTVPGSCTLPALGIDAAIVDDDGNELPNGRGGLLVIRKPWPSMLRGIHGDRARYIETYWSRVEGMYTAGDAANRDERGYFWIMGRIDDVINVSGHRLGTMEVESALVSHPDVVEAAVVGFPHEIKGTGIAAFVTLASGVEPDDALKSTLRAHTGHEIGAIAKPDLIRFTNALPKTRSGKIMRRLLRDIAAGRDSNQDTTTLEDLSVLANLRADED